MTSTSNIEVYANLIEGQKELFYNALRQRGKYSGDDREPSDLRQNDVRAYKWTAKDKPFGDALVLDSSIVAPYYPPSVTPLERLKKICIKDLQVETHHHGTYLMLAASMSPYKIAGVTISLLRDEANATITVSHHYEDAETFTSGHIFIIKEPYFTITSDGDYSVRVDHITDLFQISDQDERVPLTLRRSAAISSLISADWKHEGDIEMGKGRFPDAVSAYTSALKCHSTPDECRTLLMNRALADLKICFYDKALTDVRPIIAEANPPEKALYRASQALYHLNRFHECLQTLKMLLRDYPENMPAIRGKARVIQRLVEQTSGKYDFRTMCTASKAEPLSLDNATYVGAVTVGESRGRGFGLFTTRNVVAGELLLCEKAFSYSYEKRKARKSGDPSAIPIQANILTNRITIGTQVSLLKETIQNLSKRPSFLPSVSALHRGSYNPLPDAFVDGQPVIDTFLIYHIVSLNTFGCPIISQACHANGRALPTEQVEHQHSSSGLWIHASRINHSCYGNARASFIGDMQIVRAACDMLPHTEITFLYQAAKPNRSESSSSSHFRATQDALKNWGFECACCICSLDQLTPERVLRHRDALLDDLESSFKDFEQVQLPKAEKILAALENTYALPAVNVPRLAIWQPYLFITRQYVAQNRPEETITTAHNLLNALGFEIQGLPKTFQVIKWGLVVDHVIEVFMHIWKACQSIQPDLCEPLERAARTAYTICVGEEVTFWETYGKWYGMEKSHVHDLREGRSHVLGDTWKEVGDEEEQRPGI